MRTHLRGRPESFVDLFCGTAAVSAFMRARGFRVTANDSLLLCKVFAEASLLADVPPRFDGLAAAGVTSRHAEGRYGEQTLARHVMAQLELRLANRQLALRVAEVEAERDRTAMLGREIDHRVMNSLQFVSGLLVMQAKSTSDKEAARQLEIASSRVHTVAQVHRHFYVDDAVETTSARDYAERLVAELAAMIEPCTAIVTGDPAPIHTTLVMPLGLIANELVTNAAKHGARRVEVRIASQAKGVSLTVSDDGPGLPPNFDPERQTGLGMKVIRSLVRQHRGSLEFAKGETSGATFKITLQ